MMRPFSVAVLALVLCVCLFSGAAFSLDRATVFLLQNRLTELGFDAGEPDGRIGPRTRSAIAAYSANRNITPNPEAVLADIVDRSYRARGAAELSEIERERLESVVRENLRDPQSAIFDEEIFRFGEVFCGQVNARNSFGGYVGRRYFQVFGASISGFPLTFGFLGLDNEEMGVVWFRCNTTF